MNDSTAIITISFVSLILGVIKFQSLAKSYVDSSWQLKFIEAWNDFMNFFIAGLIAYYFILVRWPLLLQGQILNLSDSILFFVFILGVFGHLCVMSLNITKGVEAILKRVLRG